MRDDVRLVLDGTEHRGWTSVSITRGIELMAASFTLGLSDPLHKTSKPRAIAEFMPVEVWIDDDLVISGFVDSVAPGYDARTHSISVSGRSRTGQLADCSADIATGELRDIGLAAIATKLAAPIGISVIDRVPDAAKPFDRVEIEPGETVAEILARLALQRGVFLTDDVKGNLVITRRGDALQDPIEHGKNVFKMKAKFDGTERHDTITVKGQRTGSDSRSAAASSAPVGTSSDASVALHRPLVILSETQGDAAALTARAQYEVAMRKGRGRRWTYELQDWRGASGALWQSGEPIPVIDPLAFLDDALLAIELTFTRDRSGTRTELILAQPEGYDLRAVPESRTEATGWT